MSLQLGHVFDFEHEEAVVGDQGVSTICKIEYR